MQKMTLISFTKLKTFCENEYFKGWDPYDGLNSKIFQTIPFLKKSAFCRLVVIQGFKRFPINLRKLALVQKTYNAKGIGLFLSGYCNLYHAVENKPELEQFLGSKTSIWNRINELSELLFQLQSKGYSGACWGYDFDWQSKAFFLPANTPTVVATSFVVEGLLSAYEITSNSRYLDCALSSADFILKDLNRISKPNDCFMFSYSPLDHRAVYNATLLGSKTLSLIYRYTRNNQLRDCARLSVQAVCDVQNEDGSFPHSDQVGNRWRDNFHTGFKLESLALYQKCCSDNSFNSFIEKGYNYWINNFFIHDQGIAKYYDSNKDVNLIDLHCFAQAFPTLYKIDKFDSNIILLTNLLNWSISNMQDLRGYFYFQKKGSHMNKIPYMRWPNAWMFYGISYWLLYNSKCNVKLI